MKRLLFALGCGFLGLTPSHAVLLRLTNPGSPELVVLGDNDSEVARVPAGTVGQAIESDEQKFILSFGEDADGSWVAVLSPVSPEPKDFAVKAGSELPAVLRAVEAGLVGAVSAGGRRIPPGMQWMVSSNVAGPVSISAAGEGTVTIRWVGPGTGGDFTQPMEVVSEDSGEPGPPEFVEFAQEPKKRRYRLPPGFEDEGEEGTLIPSGQMSPVADPQIFTYLADPIIPAYLGPKGTLALKVKLVPDELTPH